MMIIKSIELVIFYVISPILALHLIYEYNIPLLLIFLPLFVIFIFILSIDKDFNWKELWTKGFGLWDTTRIFILFVISGLVLTSLAYFFERDSFLLFMKTRPYLWMLVMILYPLISVTTQELMYRVFFFHRYSSLFKDRVLLMICVNAVLFGYAHIIFQNWYAVLISLIGGFMFAYTYKHSRSFLAVCLEHSLYGCLIFTIGLGRYFFTGISNFS